MKNLLEKIIRKTVQLFGLNLTDAVIDGIVQFVMFGIVGVSNTMLSYILNIIVLILLRPYALAWDYVAGNVVAFILSVLWSFYWNNRVVFARKEGQHRNLWKALLKAYAAYGITGIVLSNILSWLWISVLHISKYIAPLINLVISVPLNFIINKLWTFKVDEGSH